MIASIIGNYLMEIGRISKEQLHQLFKEYRKVRAKLGVIAVSEGLMTQEKADRVNRLQAIMDMCFGDIAVEECYLTEGQVESLLKKQGNEYLAFAQAVENRGLMKVDQLDQLLVDYQYANGFTFSEIEALKSGDIDRMVTVFLPLEGAPYKLYVSTAVKTIMRLVDSEMRLDRAAIVNEYPTNSAACQRVVGSQKFTSGMMGRGNNLALAATVFGQERFRVVDLDALDAIGELVNCINGLVITHLSREKEGLELCPPDYYEGISQVKGERFLVVPLVVLGENIEFVISLDTEIELQ